MSLERRAYFCSTMVIFKLILVAVILQSFISIQAYEYCSKEKKLCYGQAGLHIVCNKEQIEPEAKYEKHYLMTDHFRDVFTYWHNYYRNEVACGRVKGKDGTLPSAKEMRQLVWDYELEYIASVHAGRCKMKHDKCRNSFRIPEGGQNLAYKKKTSKSKYSPLGRAHDATTKWFEESADTPLHVIDKYVKIPDVKIGHFTVMSNDRVGRLGCAMVSATSFPSEDRKFYYNFVTCNYDFTNIENAAVYRKGPPASNCNMYGSYGKSTNFTCLCAPTYKTENHTALF